jgi:hypothetical protein
MRERPSSRHQVARGAAARRKARYRARQRRGILCARVEVSSYGVHFLIATRWLLERDATDLAAIGSAISALLEASGRQK